MEVIQDNGMPTYTEISRPSIAEAFQNLDFNRVAAGLRGKVIPKNISRMLINLMPYKNMEDARHRPCCQGINGIKEVGKQKGCSISWNGFLSSSNIEGFWAGILEILEVKVMSYPFLEGALIPQYTYILLLWNQAQQSRYLIFTP